MADRPSFDMARLTTADKIILGGSGLLFVDSFLRWQRQCGTFKLLHVTVCTIKANEWGGSASFGGVLAALLTLALLAWKIADVSGIDLRLGVSAANVEAMLVLGSVLFTILKFFLVVGYAPTYGAWIGLLLAFTIAYGGATKTKAMNAPRPTVRSAPPLPTRAA